MYAEHCRDGIAADYRSRSGEDRYRSWRAIVMLARASVRTRSDGLAGHLRALNDNRGWTRQRQQTYIHLVTPAGRVTFERFEACRLINDRAGALLALTEIPGIGLVKAGFIAQMCGMDTGCWDSRNQARLPEAAKIVAALTQPTRDTAAQYVALCDQYGHAAGMWDDWCRAIALPGSRQRWDSPDAVSAAHMLWYDLSRALF